MAESPTTHAIVDIEPIARQDLHSETMARLAQIVVSSVPGSRLPTEQELCRQLGVGRSTLREAIRALSLLGAVQVRQGSGTYVKGGDSAAFEKLIGLCLLVQRSRVEEVVGMRRVLELEAVRLAALHHRPEDREELEETMAKMSEHVAVPAEAAKLDLRFHVILARASSNGVLLTFISGMRVFLETWMHRAINQQSVTAEVICEHNAILKAVFARNADLAAERMDAHLTRAAARLLAVIGEEQLTSNYVSAMFNIK